MVMIVKKKQSKDTIWRRKRRIRRRRRRRTTTTTKQQQTTTTTTTTTTATATTTTTTTTTTITTTTRATTATATTMYDTYVGTGWALWNLGFQWCNSSPVMMNKYCSCHCRTGTGPATCRVGRSHNHTAHRCCLLSFGTVLAGTQLQNQQSAHDWSWRENFNLFAHNWPWRENWNLFVHTWSKRKSLNIFAHIQPWWANLHQFRSNHGLLLFWSKRQ